MESVFVIGLGCVAWTGFELFRLTSTSTTIAMPADARSMGCMNHPATSRSGQFKARAEQAARPPRFAAWDDRGRPVTVEDLGRS